MKIILAKPRGFCAGVERAVLMVERALEIFGKPVYIRHEIVHNRFVINELRQKGAVFVDRIDEIPPQSIVIFSAHGISRRVHKEAKERRLRIFDATCPLVTKVHLEVHKFNNEGRECILIGHKDHPEVEGTLGQFEKTKGGSIYLVEDTQQARTIKVCSPEHLAYVTQTTLSVDDTQKIIAILKERFPNIKEPPKDDICYATQNRQNAVKELVKQCDIILVIGSRNSSNSNRLCELARRSGIAAYLIDGTEDINKEWFARVKIVGLTAGASAPETLVGDVLSLLSSWGGTQVSTTNGTDEQVVFNLPSSIRKAKKPAAEHINTANV